MLVIREEQEADHQAIKDVTIAAFLGSEFGHNGEAELVDQIRNLCSMHLSLVAERDGEIVGHVMFSPVTMETAAQSVIGMGLAPVSVRPDCQQSGVGSALLNAAFEKLAAVNCSFVVVLGHPEYYARFGFASAEKLGITHGFAGIPQDVFLIRKAETDAAIHSGRVFYDSVFGPQHSHQPSKHADE